MKLSLIIPFFNEEENIQLLIDAIQQAVKPLGLPYELVFVNDGSTDKSQAIIEENLVDPSQHIKIIELMRNYGQTAAIAAGIDNSDGEIIILLDADLQNDPADIPLLLEKLEEGYDVVSGWRKNRRDNFLLRTLPSRIANGLISNVTGLKLHDYGCTLKAYRRKYLSKFRLYGEMHRFIPVYAQDSGAKVTEVVVNHHPRTRGKSKYGLDRILKVILDLITVKFLMSYSAKPMRFFGGAGLGLMLLSSAILVFLALRRIIFSTSVMNSPFFAISSIMFIMGFFSLSFGLIAELLIRTYFESQGKSTFAIRSIIESEGEK
jgi:glycosyltransferase involved in cell wall biosynthesis